MFRPIHWPGGSVQLAACVTNPEKWSVQSRVTWKSPGLTARTHGPQEWLCFPNGASYLRQLPEPSDSSHLRISGPAGRQLRRILEFLHIPPVECVPGPVSVAILGRGIPRWPPVCGPGVTLPSHSGYSLCPDLGCKWPCCCHHHRLLCWFSSRAPPCFLAASLEPVPGGPPSTAFPIPGTWLSSSSFFCTWGVCTQLPNPALPAWPLPSSSSVCPLRSPPLSSQAGELGTSQKGHGESLAWAPILDSHLGAGGCQTCGEPLCASPLSSAGLDGSEQPVRWRAGFVPARATPGDDKSPSLRGLWQRETAERIRNLVTQPGG